MNQQSDSFCQSASMTVTYYVHFDADPTWGMVIEKENTTCELTHYEDIVIIALPAYNEEFGFSYGVDDTSVCLYESGKFYQKKLDSTIGNLGNGQHIFIRINGSISRLPEISPAQRVRYYDLGNYIFDTTGDRLTAINCFFRSLQFGSAKLASLLLESQNDSQLEKYVKFPQGKELIDRVLHPIPFNSVEECIFALKSEIKLKQFISHAIKEFARLDLQACINYILLHYELFEYLPLVTDAYETSHILPDRLKALELSDDILLYLLSIFYHEKSADAALSLVYDPCTILQLSPRLIRKVMWLRFLNRDFTDLYSLLQQFFKTHQSSCAGILNFDLISKVLTSIKSENLFRKQMMQNTTSGLGHYVDTIDNEMADYTCIVIIAALFMAINCYSDEYNLIVEQIRPLELCIYKLPQMPIEYMVLRTIPAQCHFNIFDMTKPDNIILVGDEYVFPLKSSKLDERKDAVRVVIPKFRIFDLQEGKEGGRGNLFWKAVDLANDQGGFNIVIGAWDFIESLPFMTQNAFLPTATECINYLANILRIVFAKIRERFPNIRLGLTIINWQTSTTAQTMTFPTELDFQAQVHYLSMKSREILPSDISIMSVSMKIDPEITMPHKSEDF